MNDNKFQKKVFTPDGRTRWWAHLICLFVACTIDIMFMVRIEPPTDDNADEVFLVGLAIFGLYAVIYLPIQYVLRYVLFPQLPYIVIPLAVYLGINIIVFFALAVDMADTVPVLFDSAMLGFLHFPMLFYILFSMVLHQFSPIVITKQIRTDILDDL